MILFLHIAPNSAPDGVTAVTMSSTVISVNWNSLPAPSRNGIIRYYTVSVIELQTSIASQFNSTLESLTLNNLHPAYDYQIQVAAVTVSTGPFSTAVTTTTAEDGMTIQVINCLICNQYCFQRHQVLL